MRKISPGVRKLVPPELHAVIWQLYDDHPVLPSFFDLDRGRPGTIQKITHFCLIPYHWQQTRVEHASPIDNVRLVLVKEEDTLLLRLRNRKLEEDLSKKATTWQTELKFERE